MDKINRFKECREKTPYTQKQVAMIIGVKPPQLSKWERGEGISRKNCIQLAKLYNVSADYLLGLSDDPSPNNAPQAQKEPAIPDRLDDQFRARVASLSPENWARMDAYLDGLLAAQDAQAP